MPVLQDANLSCLRYGAAIVLQLGAAPVLTLVDSTDHCLVFPAHAWVRLLNRSDQLRADVRIIVAVETEVVLHAGLSLSVVENCREHAAFLHALGSVSSSNHLQYSARMELVANVEDNSKRLCRHLDVKPSGKLWSQEEDASVDVLRDLHLSDCSLGSVDEVLRHLQVISDEL